MSEEEEEPHFPKPTPKQSVLNFDIALAMDEKVQALIKRDVNFAVVESNKNKGKLGMKYDAIKTEEANKEFKLVIKDVDKVDKVDKEDKVQQQLEYNGDSNPNFNNKSENPEVINHKDHLDSSRQIHR